MGRLEPRLVNSVRLARESSGLTQAALAEAVGVSRQTIGALEKGSYSPSTLVALRLAVVLARRIDDLFALPAEELDRLRPHVVG